MRWFRYWLGRHLVHLGLWVFPQGRVKDELYDLLNEWGRNVTAEINRAKRVGVKAS